MPSPLSAPRRLLAATLLALAMRSVASADEPVDALEHSAEPVVTEDSAEPVVTEDSEEAAATEVVVTGARAARQRSESVVNVEVIGRKEIEEGGARDAAELLEERAGVEMTRSFRGAELRLRGLDPKYTLMLIDGERVAGRVGGGIDLSRFGVEGIERVEIVRGPSSALYGSDAIGGVVNIVPRRTARPLAADGMLSYGSRGVLDGTGRVAYRPVEDLSLELTGGYHGAHALMGDGQVTTRADQRRQWSLGGRVEYSRNEVHRLVARADFQSINSQGVDAGAGSAVFDRTQLTRQLEASLSHRATPSERVSVESRGSFSQVSDEYFVDQRRSDALDRYEENREQMIELSSVVDVRANARNSTTAGFEFLHQALDSERLERAGLRARAALFAQHELSHAGRRGVKLSLVPGLRLDVDSQFGTQLSPKLSVRVDATERLVFRATYGRGFRAPSFQELLMRFENASVGYQVMGNPELGAERSHGIDAGVEYTAADWVTLSATFFRNDLRGMIATVTVPGGGPNGTLFSYENLTTAWTMGVESQAVLRVKDYLAFTAGYTFTDTHDGENDRRLEGRARHRVTVTPRVEYEPWQLVFTARAAILLDRQFYVDDDGDGVSVETTGAPLAQLDLRLAKSFTRHLELFVGVENVLNAGDRFTVLRPLTFLGGARGRY